MFRSGLEWIKCAIPVSLFRNWRIQGKKMLQKILALGFETSRSLKQREKWKSIMGDLLIIYFWAVSSSNQRLIHSFCFILVSVRWHELNEVVLQSEPEPSFFFTLHFTCVPRMSQSFVVKRNKLNIFKWLIVKDVILFNVKNTVQMILNFLNALTVNMKNKLSSQYCTVCQLPKCNQS